MFGKVGVIGLISGIVGLLIIFLFLVGNFIFGFLVLFMFFLIKEEINEMVDILGVVFFIFNVLVLDLFCLLVKFFNVWEFFFCVGFLFNFGIFLCIIDNFVNCIIGFWSFGINVEVIWGNLIGDWGSCDLVGDVCNEGRGDFGDFFWRLVNEMFCGSFIGDWGIFIGDWGIFEGLKRLFSERLGEKKEEFDWLVFVLDRIVFYIKISYIRNYVCFFI